MNRVENVERVEDEVASLLAATVNWKTHAHVNRVEKVERVEDEVASLPAATVNWKPHAHVNRVENVEISLKEKYYRL